MRQRPGDFVAQPVGPDRHRSVGQRRRAFLTPRRHHARRPIAERTVARVSAERLEQFRQSRFRIAHQPKRIGIRSAELPRVYVNLHAGRIDCRNAPRVGHLIAGVAADEQYQLSRVHDLVGGRRGIVSGATNRQPMAGGNDTAPTERRRDRSMQRLGEREQFLSRAGLHRAGAGDDGNLVRRT